MPDTPERHEDPRSLRHKEFEDPHYHDDDEDVGSEEGQGHGPRTRPKRSAGRKLPPPPRHFPDD